MNKLLQWLVAQVLWGLLGLAFIVLAWLIRPRNWVEWVLAVLASVAFIASVIGQRWRRRLRLERKELLIDGVLPSERFWSLHPVEREQWEQKFRAEWNLLFQERACEWLDDPAKTTFGVLALAYFVAKHE